MTQAGIVVSQFFNSFAVRTEEQSIAAIGIFSNKPLVFAGLFGIAFVSCVSYVPALQAVFNTAPLSATTDPKAPSAAPIQKLPLIARSV